MDIRNLVGRKRVKDEQLTSAPEGWISSRRAAEILQVNPRTARAQLTRYKARFVSVKGMCGAKLWAESDVRLFERDRRRTARFSAVPDGWCLASEACLVLNRSRSNLRLLVKGGKLQERKARVECRGGARVLSLYMRSEVRHLADEYEKRDRLRFEKLQGKEARSKAFVGSFS